MDDYRELIEQAKAKRLLVKDLQRRYRDKNEVVSDEEILELLPLLFDELESLEILIDVTMDMLHHKKGLH